MVNKLRFTPLGRQTVWEVRKQSLKLNFVIKTDFDNVFRDIAPSDSYVIGFMSFGEGKLEKQQNYAY